MIERTKLSKSMQDAILAHRNDEATRKKLGAVPKRGTKDIINDAKEAFAAYRGLGRDIIDDLIATIIEARTATAAERDEHREKLAAMMIRMSIPTGHGDTFDDMLRELEGALKDAKSLPTPKDYEG